MTHPRFPGPDSSLCVFWHDFERLDDTGLLWYDQGPCKLHATPVGYAAPNWGLARTARGKGYATFNGVNQSGTIPAATFNAAMGGASILTMAAVVRSNAPAINDRIFSCVAAAGRGFGLRYFTTSQMGIDAYDGAGALGTMGENAGGMAYDTTGRVSVMVASFDKIKAVGRAWRDGVQNAVTVAGATTEIGYGAAQIAQIGTWAGAANYFDGSAYALILYRNYIPSHAEAQSISRYWRDKV